MIRSIAGSAALVLLIGLCAAWSEHAVAQSPAFFRRDHGLATVDAQQLPGELDDARLAWKQSIPPGHSTPTVWQDRIFLTALDDGRLATICLNRGSGEVLWKQAVEVENLEKHHAEGGPATASCACNGKRVYSFFGSFGLLCYDMQGTPLWSKKLGPFRDEFGSASSPILVDDLVILNEDHDIDSFLIALRQDNGETVWRTPRDGFTRGYATPVVWQVAGKRQLVVAGALQLVAYDLEQGRQLWTLDGFARIVNTTPVPHGDTLFVCTWSPGGDTDARIAMEPWETAMQLWDANKNGKLENDELPAGEVRSRFFRIDLDSDQALDEAEWGKYARLFELAQNTLVALQADAAGQTPHVVWEYKRGLPYVASPLVYRDRVFLVKDGGVATLLDAPTGKLLKQGRAVGGGNYYASPVGGDGKIYVASTGGAVTVFHADERLERISTRDFGEKIAATPVLLDGRIYLRTEKAFYCFQ